MSSSETETKTEVVPVTCSVCGHEVERAYFDADNKPTCETCHDKARKRESVFVRVGRQFKGRL